MPYVIGGLIEEKSKLVGTSPEKFSEQRDITVQLAHDVLSINRQNKTVEVRNLETGQILQNLTINLFYLRAAIPVFLI